VTIRGDRRGTNFGPQLVGQYTQEAHVLDIGGDYARITGLRLRGPSRFTDNLTKADAIQAHSDLFTGTLIDHNDLSDWAAGAAIEVFGGQNEQANCPTNPAADLSLNDRVRIERNFIHHNEQSYGTVMSGGGTATLAGNTFLLNRHAIAADGELHDQYSARFNLVLSSSPKVDVFGFEQDFDMHGHGTRDQGGYAGNEVDIAWNTFLGGNRDNFDLRGQACAVDSFHNNVSMQDDDEAIQVWDQGGSSNYETASTPYLLIQNNQFGNSSPPYTDPTMRLGPVSLGVGDFDADGDDDLFLATGTAWYYSPAGAREWRFLSAKTDTIDQLAFGDFDGDGRTDVIAIHNGQFVVSWGGVSDWEVLNPDPTGGRLLLLPGAIAAMAVGDFDGDGHPDIFWADGGTWWISYGGNTPFVQVIVSSNLLVNDLRFGDFNGDGTTDVFGVVNGNWMVRYGPKGYQGFLGGWQLLRPALTATVDGLVVGDFTGSGGVGVAMSCFSITSPGCWQVSFGGIHDWHPYTIGSWATDFAAVGHFRGRVDANQRLLPVDLLFWNVAPPAPLANFIAMCDASVGVGTELCLSEGGIFPSYRYTSQDMR
jgi:hypothetical protein